MTQETADPVAPPAEDDAAPDLSPLDRHATAADIAAASERHSAAAAAAQGRVAAAAAEAEEILATAKERAEQILAEAEEQAAPLRDRAAEAEEQARKMRQIATRLDTAASVMKAAEKEDVAAAALWAEHARLTADAAKLSADAAKAAEQLQRLAGRRQELETELSGAGDDDDRAIELSTEIGKITETEKQVTAAATRITGGISAARVRIGRIVNQDPPKPPYPDPAPLITSYRFRALCLCDEIWPGRPGADLRRHEWRLLNGYSSAAPPPQPQPRRTVVITT